MKRKGYPKYKPSGVEWLGEVPEHWEVKKSKFLISQDGTGIKIGPFGSSIRLEIMVNEEDGFVVYGQENIIANNFSLGKRFLPFDVRSEFSVYFVKPNDILVTMMGTAGRCQIVPINIREGIIDSHLMRIRLKNEEVDTLFFRWFFDESVYTKRYFSMCSKGSIMQGLNGTIVSNLSIPIPPLPEQQAIAAFLDRETGGIDALIEKKKKLLELLKEKRTALISRAVTKGLSGLVSRGDAEFAEWAKPVKMKPSGVEWLGEVPEDWEVKRLKYIKAKSPNAFVDGPFGSNLKSEHFIINGDVFVIESNFATRGKLAEEELKQIEYDHYETIKRSETKAGDIIIAKIGAYFGLNNILQEISKKAVVSGNSMKLTINKLICDVQFIHYQLLVLKWNGAIDLMVSTTAQPALSLGDMNSLNCILPPLPEQKAIAAFLDRETAKLDALSAKVEMAIEKLKEFRTALISAAVTGKIDVREAV